MSNPVEEEAGAAPLTEYGLLAPAVQMQFTAHFSRPDGRPDARSAAEAATAALTRVIDAPRSFVAPVLAAGRSVSDCLLARTTAEVCRIVLTADGTGITVAATDDTSVAEDADRQSRADSLPLLLVIGDLRVHHGPDGHVWVVWHGPWSRDGVER
ncbi:MULTISPECIES: hypothetical protein [Streptomyces]|uniref:hypothetical protein n=1 Tax=Streptomyces TaxID=1883 RepID=UPI001670D6EC|nr:hypothetical protein [Streptomyces ruber]